MTHPAIASLFAVMLIVTIPGRATAATRYVADTGVDSGACGMEAGTACRSITQAIALASPGDTVLVGPGRYGDLNRNGILGDISGEETGSPGCGCMLSINKYVIVISSGGAAVTIIDGRSVDVGSNVLVITDAGEFGRPGKGFSVTSTVRVQGFGIAIDAGSVMVRGNQVLYTGSVPSEGAGILSVNTNPLLIEGNQAVNWSVGISVRGAIVSKNQVMSNGVGIFANGATVVGNVATANGHGIEVTGSTNATTNSVYINRAVGLLVFSSFTGVISKNNIFANGTEVANCGLDNRRIGLIAKNNYWGTSTGPGWPPADTVCSNAATTSPFATKPFAVKVLKP